MSQVLSEFGKLIGTSANNIQVTVMPQASTVDVGTIVQYIGATDANYTNGYFYKCVSDGASTPTLSWENISVQEGGAGGTFIITATPSVDPSTGAVTWTLDKTPAEVEEAYSAGLEIAVKAIMAANDVTMMYLSERGVVNGTVQFYFCNTSLFEMAERPRLIGGWGAIAYATSDDTTWTEIKATQKIIDWTQATSLSTMGPYSDGEIVQYIGTTTSSYTNGYFYKYNATAQTWTRVDVQPASDAAATFVITISGDGDTTPYTADKTPEEVEAAYAAGKVLVVRESGELMYIPFAGRMPYDENMIFFEFAYTILQQPGDITSADSIGYYLIYTTGQSTWTVINRGTITGNFINQFDSMPDASNVDNYNKIIQYTGATNANYTNGYFYKLTQNSSGGGYSWTQLNVQPGSGGGVFIVGITGSGEQGDPYVADKTPEELYTAISAGIPSFVIYTDGDGVITMLPYMTFYADSAVRFLFGATGVSPDYKTAEMQLCTLTTTSMSSWSSITNEIRESSPTFDITLSGDGDTIPYSVDKTPEEVEDAISAGQVVRMITSEAIMQYFGLNSNTYCFGIANVNADKETHSVYVLLSKGASPSVWSSIQVLIQETDISSKADKVSSATSGNFAALDANGNLTDSGHKHSDYLTSHQDISGKADKPATATTGNFASFDANKNPVDSGKKASDFLSGTVGVANGGTGQTTLTANAVLTGNGTTAVKQVTTASGALYATAANGAPTFGTLPAAQGGTGNTSLQATRNAMGLGNTTGALPVANGGTGATTFTSGAALIGSGTSAVTTRAITNNTAKTTAPAGSTNLATMNSLLYGMQNYNNRASAVNAADTNYTTAMARAIYATTTDPGTGATMTNGTICLVYE